MTTASATGTRVARGVVWSAAESWTRHLVSFAVAVVLARQLGADDFGLAALAMVAPVILAAPVTTGFPDALIQRPELEPIHTDSVFWLLLGTGFLLSLLVWCCAAPIARALDEPRLAELVRWTSASVLLQAAASVPAAVLRRNLDFRLLALRNTTGTMIGGGLGVALATAGFGVWSLVGMQLGTVAIESAILLGFGQWRPRLRFSPRHCRDLFGFAGPLTLHSLLTLANDELPKVIIGLIVGTPAVGIFAFARRPLEFLTQGFLGPVASVSMPTVSRLQGQPDKIDAFFLKAARMAALVGFPVFIGFAAVASGAVPLLFGEHWAEAVPAVQILMLVGVSRSLESLPGLSLLALGHSRLLLKLALLYTALCLLLVPAAAHFGLAAALAAVLLCNVAMLPIYFVLAERLARVDVLRALAIVPRLAFCVAIMVAAIELLRRVAPASGSSPLQLALEVGIGGAAFLAATALLLPRDLLSARDVLNRIRR